MHELSFNFRMLLANPTCAVPPLHIVLLSICTPTIIAFAIMPKKTSSSY